MPLTRVPTTGRPAAIASITLPAMPSHSEQRQKTSRRERAASRTAAGSTAPANSITSAAARARGARARTAPASGPSPASTSRNAHARAHEQLARASTRSTWRLRGTKRATQRIDRRLVARPRAASGGHSVDVDAVRDVVQLARGRCPPSASRSSAPVRVGVVDVDERRAEPLEPQEHARLGAVESLDARSREGRGRRTRTRVRRLTRRVTRHARDRGRLEAVRVDDVEALPREDAREPAGTRCRTAAPAERAHARPPAAATRAAIGSRRARASPARSERRRADPCARPARRPSPRCRRRRRT